METAASAEVGQSIDTKQVAWYQIALKDEQVTLTVACWVLTG